MINPKTICVFIVVPFIKLKRIWLIIL